MTDYETIHRLHMQDMKHINERAADRQEARTIGWITVFYLCVLVVVILCS